MQKQRDVGVQGHAWDRSFAVVTTHSLRARIPPPSARPPPAPPAQEAAFTDEVSWGSLVQVLRGIPFVCFQPVQESLLVFTLRLLRACRKSPVLAARTDAIEDAVHKVRAVRCIMACR